MTSRSVALLLAILVAMTSTGCASSRSAAAWRPGDAIVCPHCGREFPLPEKLGP